MRSNYKFFCFQQGQSDCGVACLLSLIQYHGGANTVENLRRLSGTTTTGTTLLGLYQAAKECGFDAQGCEADIAALIQHQKPCILHVMLEGSLQHYVVCFGTSQKNNELKFIIGDPAKGIIYLDRNELDKIWQTKTCLTLQPNKHFQKIEVVKNAKLKWIRELIKDDISLLAIAAVIGVGIAVLGIVMAVFSQRLIDDILPKKDFSKLNVGIALVFLLLIIKEGLSALRHYFLLRQSKDFNIRIIDFFYNRLLHLPKPFFDTRKIGELTARLNDTSRIQRVISQLAGNVIIDVLVMLVSAGFVFFYSWQVGIACLVAAPVFYFIIFRHHKKISEGQRSIMSGHAMAESNYISTLQGVEPVKNNNKQVLFANTNKVIYLNYQDKVVVLGKIQIRLSFLANSFAAFFLMSILLFCSYRVLSDQLKTGELMAILGMCGTLLPAVANLALITIPINEAKIAFDRMFEFAGIKPEDCTPVDEGFQFVSLEVQHLGFRFAGRSRILDDISFTVKKGEIIAIMGENGCGKSTLTHILQKNYKPESGTVFVNNDRSLDDLGLLSWRNTIGIVPQNIHIFNGTVLENIAFEDASAKPQDVLQFLQSFGFAAFIDNLPQSFMTIVGEEGINLSGGQKQMIALARALYHKPQLLILDEATAAMDRQSEQFVLHLLNGIKKELGIICITHRLHVLKNFCDRIYILEKGHISVSGDHQHLLASENLYSQYWTDLVQ